jgi:hypothetical protein
MLKFAGRKGLFVVLLAASAALLTQTRCQAPAVTKAPAPTPALLSWRVASAHLEDIFTTIPNSSIDDFRREIPDDERNLINASHGQAGVKDDKAHVYGEPSPLSSDLILRLLDLGEADVLYDLGCGRGYFLMQALMTSRLKRAVGVELAASRVDIGLRAKGMLVDQGLLGPGKSLDLRVQDMTQTDLDDATVAFLNSVLFSDELLATMAKRMAKAPGLKRLVMIQKGLPANPWFEPAGTQRLKMSWSPKFGTDVLFYKRTAVPVN